LVSCLYLQVKKHKLTHAPKYGLTE
jgi:hypothetical protein